MPGSINWNQVYYFSEVAAKGSIKSAAEKLELSPSTLSEHIAQLESSLGIKLFERQHRKLLLTEEGARLFRHARQMFETGHRFIDIIAPSALNAHPVSVGMVPGSQFKTASDIVQEFLRNNGDLSLNVLSTKHEQMETMILEGRLDFGFTDRRTEKRTIVQTQVLSSELGFFVAASHPKRTLAEHLEHLPLILCQSERIGPSAVEDFLDAHDLNPRNVITSEFPAFVKQLCQEGIGIAVLGHNHFASETDVRRLALPKEFPGLVERLFVSWAVDSESSEAVRRLKPYLPLS